MNSKWLTFLLVGLIIGFGAFYLQHEEVVVPADFDKLVKDSLDSLGARSSSVEEKYEDSINVNSGNIVEQELVLGVGNKDMVEIVNDNEFNEDQMMPSADQEFIVYTNKSIGYSVDLPVKWYWQHFNAAELKEVDPGVVDYLIMDSNPLLPLGSEYLGEVVIAVVKQDLANFTQLDSYGKSEAVVGGVPAAKYKKIIADKIVIEYHFIKNGLNFRILYFENKNQAIFNRVIASFIFD